jgi:hypothetical protein
MATTWSGEELPAVDLRKPQPRIVDKIKTRKTVAKMDRLEKEAVRQRDGESCRVCGRKSRDVHERLFKSLGGIASLVNSMVACKKCHDYLQAHGIKPIGKTCNDPLKFQMCAAVAHDVFRGKAVPSHVEIVATAPGRDRDARQPQHTGGPMENDPKEPPVNEPPAPIDQGDGGGNSELMEVTPTGSTGE